MTTKDLILGILINAIKFYLVPMKKILKQYFLGLSVINPINLLPNRNI